MAAADAECRVKLIDEQEEPGGALLASPSEADIQWARDTLERIAAQKNITVLSRTTVNGYYDNNVLAALERVTNHLGPLTDDQPRERFGESLPGASCWRLAHWNVQWCFPIMIGPGSC